MVAMREGKMEARCTYDMLCYHIRSCDICTRIAYSQVWGLDFGDCHKSLFAHGDTVMQVRGRGIVAFKALEFPGLQAWLQGSDFYDTPLDGFKVRTFTIVP